MTRTKKRKSLDDQNIPRTYLNSVPDLTYTFMMMDLEGSNPKNSIFGATGFQGPGFYLTETNTVLVVRAYANPPKRAWAKASDLTDQFRALVFNCRFEQTIFSEVCTAPTRFDERRF
jgi:hypothetical protein